MAAIDLENLTNATKTSGGTGVFDKLIHSVELHINNQYEQGRITGKEYAQVYLGSIQSVISESINFLLNEQQADKQADLISEQISSEIKNNEDGGVIDLQKLKIQEDTLLVTAQIAVANENVDSSEQDTVRRNAMNTKQLLKLDADISLTGSQDAEVLAGTIRQDSLTAEQILKIQEETDLLESRDLEQIAATVRQDAMSAQQVASEIKNNETGGVIDLQKLKLQQDTLLSEAQVDVAVENVDSSQQDTTRRNALNAKQLLKLDSDIEITSSQNLEVIASTARQDALSDAQLLKIAEEVDLLESRDLEQIAATVRQDAIAAEQIASEIKNNEDGGVIDLQKEKLQEELDLVVAKTAESYEGVLASQQNTNRQNLLNAEQVTKLQEEVDLLESRDLEQIAATLRQDNESTKKQDLMTAQTLGFASDTKVKVLKQMYDGFSVALSIAGTGDVPDASLAAAMDALAQNILDEVGATSIV